MQGAKGGQSAAWRVKLQLAGLEFFKSQGRGYQARINAVLRSYMEARQGQAAEPKG